jgi:hypothetical protein
MTSPYLSDLADRGLIALCERAVVPTDIDSAAFTAVIGAVAGFVPGRTANPPAVELNVR